MPRLAPLLVLLAACAAYAPERSEGRDSGGSILLRAAEIASLEATGRGKRIAGECLSACTLYLGLSTACFEEGAVLGFHGPRLVTGTDLTQGQFDRLSRTMASFYPPRVAAWFLDEARFAERTVRIPASNLIARGEARACP